MDIFNIDESKIDEKMLDEPLIYPSLTRRNDRVIPLAMSSGSSPPVLVHPHEEVTLSFQLATIGGEVAYHSECLPEC